MSRHVMSRHVKSRHVMLRCVNGHVMSFCVNVLCRAVFFPTHRRSGTFFRFFPVVLKEYLPHLLVAKNVGCQIYIHMAIFFLKLAYFFAYHLNSAAFGVPIYEAQTMRIDPNPRTPTESRITR